MPELKERTVCVSDDFKYNEYVATIIGLALNGLLMLLIAFRTRDEFRRYSKILLLNGLVDAAFTVSSCLIELVGAHLSTSCASSQPDHSRSWAMLSEEANVQRTKEEKRVWNSQSPGLSSRWEILL